MMKEKSVKKLRKRIRVSVIIILLILGVFLSYFKFPVKRIEIKGDADFKRYRCPGKGTAEDPFRIENRILKAQDSYSAIYIRRTTKHFVIRNCIIEGSPGIQILDVGDNTAKIINCSFLETEEAYRSSFAFYIDDADGIEILNNTIHSFRTIGYIRTSNHMVFSNNYMKNNYFPLLINEQEFGLWYHNLTIDNNIFENTLFSIGLYINNVEELYIGNNQFFNSSLRFDKYDLAYNESYDTIVMENNSIDNKPIGFFKDLTYVEIHEEYGQIFLFECQLVNISNQYTMNVDSSIMAVKCGNITITNSYIDYSYQSVWKEGLFFYQCQLFKCLNVTFVEGRYSFYSLENDYIHIEDCSFYNQTRYCIYLSSNEKGLITDNLFMFHNSIEMIEDLGPQVLVENNTIITY